MKRAKRKPGLPRVRTGSSTESPRQPRTREVASPPRAEARSIAGLTVVGVGASAGGLEAFSQLLHALPDDADLALVLVQHLAPQHESALPALLGAKTRLSVHQVTDGMHIEPGHVYVIPPNVQMGITDGELHLAPRPGDRTQYTPIDFFLRSLAHSAENRAIGVILSGTASDGAIGVREIKAVGGITIAQAPESARHDGMPRAAIATGMIDLVLSPPEIAAELVQISRHPYLRQPWPAKTGEGVVLDDEQLERVFSLLHASSGVDFRHYKLPTMKRRIQRRMALNKLSGLAEYVKHLEEHPSEIEQLYQDILIHVTCFFREPESYEALATQVLPALLERRSENDPIRVWVPGCSTGEEAYSVSMTLSEFLQKENKGGFPIQIFGTDISETAIAFARSGIYPESISADVSPERLRCFFSKTDGNYQISKAVRDTCIFARQDVTRDPPFSRLDLILCRNVLIYLNLALQRRLMNFFHYALKPSGFLMLGHAETIGPHVELFELTDKKHRVYRKKLTTVRHKAGFPVEYVVAPTQGLTRGEAGRETGRILQREVDNLMLDRYAPPGVVVDPAMQIVQFRGQTGPYLEAAPGEASLNLMRMTREGLVHGLRRALNEARERRAPVRKGGLRVKSNDHWRDVSVEVVPLTVGGKMHFLVLFDEEPEKRRSPGRRAPGKADGRSREGPQVDELERELAANREHLQSTVQELEAANEELQSANEEALSSNEELQSTNEELDTAKEELQSSNEELNTVNEELHARNEELSRVNSDLMNLLASVQIAIVIVTRDLRIRHFTPMAEKMLNLIPGDVGRPIGNIRPNIDCPDLEQLCAQAVDTMTVYERDVQDLRGRWFALRVRPYKNLENRIDGAVLTLFDIDSARAQVFASAIVETVREPLVVLDAGLRVKTVNPAFCQTFRVSRAETEQRFIYHLGSGEWNIPRLRLLLEEVLPENHSFEGFEVEHEFPEVGRKRMLLNARRIETQVQGESLMLLAIEDVTEGGRRDADA